MMDIIRKATKIEKKIERKLEREVSMRTKLWQRYNEWQHHLPLAFFIGGFVWDHLTLTRIDQWLDQAILTIHLLIATTAVILMQVVTRIRGRRKPPEEGDPPPPRSFIGDRAHWYPNLFQFSLGALFSGFFVFFSRSGTLVSSWPFLLLLIAFLVGNEIFKKRYEKFIFQISVYYFVLFLFLILFVPVIIGSMSGWIFLASGIASLVVMAGFMRVLWRIAPERLHKTQTLLWGSILSIFAIMNVLYVTNIIPPIPLSLKDIGIYHQVQKIEDGYLVQYERPAWYEFWRRSDKVFHRTNGTSVYAYAAVFAPTKLSTQIFHDWQYYDESSEKWISAGRISYNVVGGRDGGFRGYTLKMNVFPGTWRVDVETARGQLLGREKFEVVAAQGDPDLVSAVR